MNFKNQSIALCLSLGLLTSACSMNNREEGLFSKLGRFLASADSIESEMSSVRSIVQELNTNGTRILDLYTYPTKIKFGTFNDNPRIQTLLKKLKTIQIQLLKETSKVDPTTTEGQKLLSLTADYLQAIVTVNKLYAMAAHAKVVGGSWNIPSAYDWNNLDPYNLLLDKRYALIIISKINFFASHMTETEIANKGLDPKEIKNAVEIQLGGEARQMLEHLAINNPGTPTDYARLLKYNAVRETLINTWAINRISSSSYDPVVNDGKAQSNLTFRPGRDGRFSTGDYYKELVTSDKYYNVYTPILREVVLATISTKNKRMTIGSAAEYAEIYRTLIYGYPEDSTTKTIQPFAPVSDFFLAKGKYEGEVPWTREYIDQMFTGEEVMNVEEADWTNEKSVNLFYTALVGDKLDPNELTRKMVDYAWLTRSIAVVTQIRHRIENSDMTNVEVTKLTNKIWQIVGRWKDRYTNHLSSTLKPILTKYLNESAVKSSVVNTKYSSLKEIVKMTEGARGAYIKHTLEKTKKVPALKMAPRTPESLISLVQYKLGKGHNEGVVFALEDNGTIAGNIKAFYTDLSNAFYKRSKGSESFETMSQILWEEAHKVAYKYYKKFPYTTRQQIDQSMRDYIEEHPAAPRDNTYVYHPPVYIKKPIAPVKTPIPKTTPKPTTTANKGKEKPLNFDQKLLMMMQSFQPYMQGQDFSQMNNRAQNEQHYELVNLDYENWRAKKSYDTTNRVLWEIFHVMGLYVGNFEVDGTYNKTQSFAQDYDSQTYLASQAVAMAYQHAPILQNEILYSSSQKTGYTTGSGMGYGGSSYTYTDYVYKPVLEVIGLKALNTSTGALDMTKTGSFIGEGYNAAMKSLRGQQSGETPATPFKEGLLETFAKSDPANYSTDKRFNFMYDKLEQLRAIMMSGAGQPQSVATKMEKLDFELYKKIHPWKYRFEKYIEPIANMVMVALMVISLIVGMVFPPAAMPAWLAMSLFVFEVSSFSFTMASNVGYRIMYQRMYEVPANLKMQTHLAAIQGAQESPLKMMYQSASGIKQYGISTPLDNWDRIKAAEKANIDERRHMILERLFWLPLDMMWGASILKMGKNLVGLSTVKSLKKLGLPVLTFNEKVKVIFKSDQWKKYIEEKGLIRGMKQVTKDVVTGLPEASKLLPKYQPYPREMLEKFGLRAGLFNKLETLHYTVAADKVIVGNAKYALTGENLTLYTIFKDIKLHDEKLFKQFIEFQATHETTKIYSKIQELLSKGVTPAEIIGRPIGRAPKTFLGVLFNGITESGRMKNLQSTMKEGVDLSEALAKFREAKPLGKEAITKVFEQYSAPGFEYEQLLKTFEEAGMKKGLKSATTQMTSNYNAWKATKTDEVKLTNLMMQLQHEFNEAKHVKSASFVDKCVDVENQLAANPEFFKEKGFNSATDYWLSLLDHSDLMMLEEIAKKAPKGSMTRDLKSVFTDYQTVMETIKPMQWKKASETFSSSTEILPVSTHANDYSEIIVRDANIYPVDGFGTKKTESMKLLESQIEEGL